MKTFIVLLAVLFLSCSKENPVEPTQLMPKYKIEGTWRGTTYHGNVILANMKTFADKSVQGSGSVIGGSTVKSSFQVIGSIVADSILLTFSGKSNRVTFAGKFLDTSMFMGNVSDVYLDEAFFVNPLAFLKAD